MTSDDSLVLRGVPQTYKVRIHAKNPVTGQDEVLELDMPSDTPEDVLKRLGLIHAEQPKRQLADLAYERYRKIVLP